MSKLGFIHLPTPCQVGPENFTPAEGGEFCKVCQKCVFDYTNMSIEEIFAHKKRYPNSCGTYKMSQTQHQSALVFKPTLRLSIMGYTLLIALILFFLSGIGNKAQGQEKKRENTAKVIPLKKVEIKKEEIEAIVEEPKERGTGSFVMILSHEDVLSSGSSRIREWLQNLDLRVIQKKPEIKITIERRKDNPYEFL